MKTTKQGIVLYEDTDSAPSAPTFTDQLSIMLNMMRKELNKMAVIIEKQQDEIEELKKQIRT